MTTERLAAVLALWCGCGLAHAAADGGERAAADGGVQLEIAGADTLPRSAHTTIPVIATLASEGAGAHPLLLTPHIEGDAVELVRGRLLRADGKRQDAAHLRFEVPVVARSEGTAILRVELMTYLCDPSCRRVIVSESRVLHVR